MAEKKTEATDEIQAEHAEITEHVPVVTEGHGETVGKPGAYSKTVHNVSCCSYRGTVSVLRLSRD